MVVPFAEVDVKLPGVIATLVAPDVDQFSALALPGAMLEGLAVNELIEGKLGDVTVTVAVAVDEPAPFVAVSVNVVVAEGLIDIEPVAEVDAKFPGVMVTLVAPEVAQLSVVPPPAVTLAGLAEKDAMVGAGVCVTVSVDTPLQPSGPPRAKRSRANPQRPSFGKTDPATPYHLLKRDLLESMRNPFAGMVESPA